jgi:hypothetical protein
MSAPKKDRPVHEGFSWLNRSLAFDQDAQFIATTFDFCTGIALCLDLVHSCNLDRSHNEDCDKGKECRPTLGITETDQLLMFAKSAARMLASKAESAIDRVNERAAKKDADDAKSPPSA